MIDELIKEIEDEKEFPAYKINSFIEDLYRIALLNYVGGKKAFNKPSIVNSVISSYRSYKEEGYKDVDSWRKSLLYNVNEYLVGDD